MIFLRKLADGGIQYPYTEVDLRRDFGKRHLIPDNLADEDLTGFGVWPVEEVAPPAVSAGQIVQHGENADGVEEYAPDRYRMVWTVRDRTPAEYEAHERALHSQIDAAAGAFRTLFITDVPGQQQTYAEKEREARTWTAGADPAELPFLAAEASARGMPIADVVAMIIATADAWRLLGAAIEGARMGAKAGVTAARQDGDWAAMDAAAAVDWEALAG